MLDQNDAGKLLFAHIVLISGHCLLPSSLDLFSTSAFLLMAVFLVSLLTKCSTPNIPRPSFSGSIASPLAS